MSTETDIRARVIEHAAKKFAANGIKSITMDEIAEQLGMSKRTLYELFKDKKKLVTECLYYFENLAKESQKKIFRETDNTFEAIVLSFKSNLEGFQQIDKKFLEDIKKYFPDINKQWEKSKNLHIEKNAGYFIKSMEEGYVVKDFNPNTISLLFYEEVEMVINAQLFNSSKIHFMEIYRTMYIIFFRGIATSKGLEVIENLLMK
ncbi:MAG TPA: TetR/AcrR family transcriptional regulator [Paludibacteraceae bacterium]|nr:TetR/AcrR family transcriptional regulator [Paludibacteraceae bacterium]